MPIKTLVATFFLFLGYFFAQTAYSTAASATAAPPPNTAILLVFNGNYYKLAANLLASMQKNTPHLIPLITICVSDDKGKAFAENHHLKYFTMSNIKDSGCYMSREMNIMTRRKFEGIIYMLEAHSDVLYIDTDIVVLSNPFKDINFNYDLNIQNDQCHKPYDTAYLCTGFMFIKSNHRTINFFKQSIAEIEKNNYKFDDQSALNLLIAQPKLLNNASPQSQISINILDVCKFPNGCRYFDRSDKHCSKQDAVIIHNNYIVGLDSKLERFKAYGLAYTY